MGKEKKHINLVVIGAFGCGVLVAEVSVTLGKACDRRAKNSPRRSSRVYWPLSSFPAGHVDSGKSTTTGHLICE